MVINYFFMGADAYFTTCHILIQCQGTKIGCHPIIDCAGYWNGGINREESAAISGKILP
jgi:hypothetical protein